MVFPGGGTHFRSRKTRYSTPFRAMATSSGPLCLVSYKRLDKVIEVGEALGMPVVIAGSGPEEAVLRARGAAASVPVLFTGRVSDEQLYALYQEASLFVFMPIEDFGIMPVECMATGTPVLVNSVGGAKESVNAVGLGAEAGIGASRAELAAAADRALLSTAARRVDATYEFSRATFPEQDRRMDRGTDVTHVLVLGTAEWDQAIATNQHYAVRELSEHHDVTYVESMGLRRIEFTWRDARRIGVGCAAQRTWGVRLPHGWFPPAQHRLAAGGSIPPWPDTSPERVALAPSGASLAAIGK